MSQQRREQGSPVARTRPRGLARLDSPRRRSSTTVFPPSPCSLLRPLRPRARTTAPCAGASCPRSPHSRLARRAASSPAGACIRRSCGLEATAIAIPSRMRCSRSRSLRSRCSFSTAGQRGRLGRSARFPDSTARWFRALRTDPHDRALRAGGLAMSGPQAGSFPAGDDLRPTAGRSALSRPLGGLTQGWRSAARRARKAGAGQDRVPGRRAGDIPQFQRPESGCGVWLSQPDGCTKAHRAAWIIVAPGPASNAHYGLASNVEKPIRRGLATACYRFEIFVRQRRIRRWCSFKVAYGWPIRAYRGATPLFGN